jgi:hypothetical protein
MSFAGAFQCSNCPKSNDSQAERACPAWWETIWTNKDGESRVEKSCAFFQLPAYTIEMIKATARSAEMGSQVRNDVEKLKEKLDGQFGLLQSLARPELQRPINTASLKCIGDAAQSTIGSNKPGDQFAIEFGGDGGQSSR